MRSRHCAAGARTPWYVRRCARGLGTSAASRSRKTNGSKTIALVAFGGYLPAAHIAKERGDHDVSAAGLKQSIWLVSPRLWANGGRGALGSGR